MNFLKKKDLNPGIDIGMEWISIARDPRANRAEIAVHTPFVMINTFHIFPYINCLSYHSLWSSHTTKPIHEISSFLSFFFLFCTFSCCFMINNNTRKNLMNRFASKTVDNRKFHNPAPKKAKGEKIHIERER